MKNIIDKIIRTGYSRTKKYTVDDLIKYFYPIKYVIEKNDTLGIGAKENPFWNSENRKRRMDFYHDLQGLTKDITKGTRYTMLNRFENGDRYGIELT